jgi:hypothetical protein
LATYLGWGLLEEGLLGENEAEALIAGLIIFLACMPAYRRGLGALGSEGPALALLRPFVRPSDLIGYKTVAVLAFVVPAGVLLGAAAGGLSQALEMKPSALDGAAIAGLTAVVAAIFSVALSFLFPDFKRQNVLAPGSSRLGRLTFISVAFYAAGVVGGLRWLTRTGTLPSTSFVPGLLTAAGVAIALAGGVMILALRRFPHLEY